jgi:hypothetical protein
MKKWAVVILTLTVALGIGFLLSKSDTTRPDNKVAQDAAVAAALSRQSTNTIGIIASNFARVQPVPASSAQPPVPAGQPAPLQFTNFAPATVLENMSHAVRQYGRMFGGNPVGTNPEITSQLTGKNPKHLNFIDPEAGLRINAAGELVDPWGTPFFFHQISGTDMEIHSAGPDRIMWTGDDLVTK